MSWQLNCNITSNGIFFHVQLSLLSLAYWPLNSSLALAFASTINGDTKRLTISHLSLHCAIQKNTSHLEKITFFLFPEERGKNTGNSGSAWCADTGAGQAEKTIEEHGMHAEMNYFKTFLNKKYFKKRTLHK